MDDDVELIVPDNLDDSHIGGMFPDFSQVQIQVHGSDVAGTIIGGHSPQEIFGTEQYLDSLIYDDIQEISDEYPEQDEPETITDSKENIFNRQESTQVDVGMIEPAKYHNEEFGNVKRIPDKDISNYDVVIEEYPDYPNLSIKEEIEPFVGTDYTDFDAGPIEHNSDDIPPEDIYHCNNVIILGSKPCPSTSNGILKRLLSKRDSLEEKEVKKEHMNAVVLVEDWGVNLVNSQSFCKDCGTLFVTPNELDAHNMIAHSFLVPVIKNVAIKSTTKPPFTRKSTGAIVVKGNKNIARKSTGSKAMGSTFCNHCNKVFPDNTTLIKHLYELLTLKQFSCNTCNAVFKSQKDLTDHNIVHIKSEKVTVKKEKTDEVGNLKTTLSRDVKIKKPMSPKADIEAVPKSILFQCPKCGVHFVTAFAGFLHYLCCSPTSRKKPVTCEICKRKVQAKDMNIHRKQHKLCTKFRVLKVIKGLSERTLCKCANCGIYFTELGMLMHFKNCGKLVSEQCLKCNILLPKTKFVAHNKMHTHQHLKPKDFLHIQYSIHKTAVKRKMEPPKTPAKKIKLEYPHKTTVKMQKLKIKEPIEVKPVQNAAKVTLSKKEYKFRMFFCRHCKGCCFRTSHRTKHLKKQCLMHKKVICSICGLQFGSKSTLKYHRTLHKKEFVIHDVAFFDLHTMRSTIPLIPDYPQCSDCNITFFNARVHEEHVCGEDYSTCVVCGEKYHNSAFNAHTEFHKLIETKPSTSQETKLIPELMKKYESLNMMWNLLYWCKMCHTITDQYDKAVEHSQGHLNLELMTKNIKCYICNLKFDETCWSKHSELHSRMNINSNDFNILSFNPRKLLTEEWFELFHSLPTEQIRQLTDKSVYGSERRFKMKLLKEGRSEFTIYCCSDCKVGCRNNEIKKHINSTCKNSSSICKICSIPFSDISTLRNHQIMHLNGIKKEEFRVVSFAKQIVRIPVKQTKRKVTKRQINKKISKKVLKRKPKLIIKRKNGKIITNKKAKKTYRGVEIDSNTGKYVLHRCNSCKICIHTQCNATKHKCDTKIRAVECQQCYEQISIKYRLAHEQRHVEKSDFNINNFIFKVFDPPNKAYNSEDELKPVKKKRRLLNRKKTKKNVTKINKGNTSNSVDNTKKAKQTTPKTNNMSKDTLNVSSAVKTAIVYKCDCGLHYTSLKNIEKHVQTCDSDIDISKEHCSKCGLLFPTDVLVSHLCKHHSKNSKFIVESYRKEPQANVESTSESPMPARKTHSDCKVKLYKCNECNVHYVNRNTCYKHVYKKHQSVDKRKCIECKMCGLQFTINSLNVHVTRHHRDEFSLDDVLIEEYRLPVGKGPLQVELYNAGDKVQSFQVTSSIEESILS